MLKLLYYLGNESGQKPYLMTDDRFRRITTRSLTYRTSVIIGTDFYVVILGVHFKPMLHVSVNLSFGVWPPSSARYLPWVTRSATVSSDCFWVLQARQPPALARPLDPHVQDQMTPKKRPTTNVKTTMKISWAVQAISGAASTACGLKETRRFTTTPKRFTSLFAKKTVLEPMSRSL